MIKRYIFNRCDENWAEEPDGDIVLFSDHAADRERMKKIIDEQNQRLAAVIVELGELKKLHDAEITLAELRQETIYSLRACIETAEKQEPDSWRVTSHRCCGTHTTDKEIAEHWMKTGEAYPLYALPPMPAQQGSEYPMQPIIDGRFEANPIVNMLVDKVGLNEISVWRQINAIPIKYTEQLAQLIGYSLGGYSELDYVSDESYERAVKLSEQKTYTAKVYNKGGSGEFKRVEGIDALEDGQKLIAIQE